MLLLGNLIPSLDYVFCNRGTHDPKHTFFSCERWDVYRRQLYANTGKLPPDGVVREMLRIASRLNRVVHYEWVLIAKEIRNDWF